MLNISGLTLNPKEQELIRDFIIPEVVKDLTMNGLITIEEGVKMKQQVVFVGEFGMTGIKDATCTAPESGAELALTQKYWEPEPVGDRLNLCVATLNSLFKAYFGQITSYRERFDMTGSDLNDLLSIKILESIKKAFVRLFWHGDKGVAVSGVATAGLISAANVKFFDSCNGLWDKIFTGVGAGDVARYTITKNTEATKAAQIALTAGASITYFNAVWNLASPELKQAANKEFLVTGEIFEDYIQYLTGKGENFTIEYTTEGFQMVKWRGIPVVDMSVDWDKYNRAYFEGLNDHSIYWLPNRIILSTKENLMAATLNLNDTETVDFWYEKKDEKVYARFGFTIDTNYGIGNLIVVGY